MAFRMASYRRRRCVSRSGFGVIFASSLPFFFVLVISGGEIKFRNTQGICAPIPLLRMKAPKMIEDKKGSMLISPV